LVTLSIFKLSICQFQKQKSPKTKNHLICTNLIHLGAVVQTLSESEKPFAVQKVFNSSSESSSKVVVDVVAHGGLTWTRVIARLLDRLLRLF
jgi:hypothetical protein